MESIIWLFFPALLSVKVDFKLRGTTDCSWMKFLMEYGFYNIGVNLLSKIIWYFIFGFTNGIVKSIEEMMAFGIYYGITACFVALVIPVVKHVICKYISISCAVREVADEKKDY